MNISGKHRRLPENTNILVRMQAIEQKILSRIYGRGRGWAFTKTDFVAGFGEANIHQALARKFNWRIQPSGEAALNLLGL